MVRVSWKEERADKGGNVAKEWKTVKEARQAKVKIMNQGEKIDWMKREW